jgi:hypothetical protein
VKVSGNCQKLKLNAHTKKEIVSVGDRFLCVMLYDLNIADFLIDGKDFD